MPTRRRLIVANWKMNAHLQSAISLAKPIAEWALKQAGLPCDLVLCPPSHLLIPVGEAIKGSAVRLGAQDCHWATHGPFTGDISAPQLVNVGCQYVILGHSERRQSYGEASPMIARKVEAAQQAGLTPIVCVGETEQQKEQGMAQRVIEEQVRQSLPDRYDTKNIVIAYEPVWAIGTGEQPGIDDIAQTMKLIRDTLGAHGATTRVLYGGSVAPSNAGSIFSSSEVDGALVGSAGLTPEGYIGIVEKVPH